VSPEQGGGWDTTAYNIAGLLDENCLSTSCGSRLFNIITCSGAERRQPFCLFYSAPEYIIMLSPGGRVTAPLGVIAAKEI